MRRTLALVLYVLLLCMQHEVVRHGFDHLKPELAQAHERGIDAAVLAQCDECALLAGAAHALDGRVASRIVARIPDAPVVAILSGTAAAAPVHYSARAPPLLA
jgi:hypothetical protein